MKRWICLMGLSWFVIAASAQSLGLSTDKTTSLVFPFSIRHADCGTKDVLIQPIKEAGNILLVKAGIKDFSESNLTVVTEDGSIYSFRLQYDHAPSSWIYRLPVQFRATLSTYANGILDNERTMRGIRDKKWNIEAKVIGIYIRGNVIFYQLRIDNQSPIDYDVELLRFFIKDKKKSKRTALQENELSPLYVMGNTRIVKANATNVIVVALDKFTIPDAKFLGIQLMEKNGGRHLQMKVNNRKIMKAIPLPDQR